MDGVQNVRRQACSSVGVAGVMLIPSIAAYPRSLGPRDPHVSRLVSRHGGQRAPRPPWAARLDIQRLEVGAMSELQCVARLKIHAGKLDEFKRLAAKCTELVRTKDTGTLQYELYLNGDNTECLVFERYRDSQALLLDHFKNMGDTMTAIFQTCTGSRD